VGIVVTAILILPLLRVGGMQLFRTESSDRAEKIVPRAVELVRYIVVIYVVLSVACALTYWSLGMSAFDAVCHAMTTLSTGGFSTHDASFAYFENPYIEWAAVVFMTSGALPFVAYIATVRGGGQPLWRDTQARTFVLSMIAVSLVLALVIAEHLGLPFIEAIRLAAFNSVSIATTTGYASADYVEWGGFAVMVFMLLTLMGGCTGSTAGAIKMFRHQIMFIAARTHVANLLSPNLVSVPTYQGRPVTDDVLRSVLVFVVVYFGVLVVLSLGVASYGYDLVTSLSAAATAMGNVGPGLGPIIGPAGNFADLPDGAKWLLSAGMLMGRLEFFTVLVLFDRQFWHW
jgi:trk system potassium uptake protein TrkH